jgi:hypothetical protein
MISRSKNKPFKFIDDLNLKNVKITDELINSFLNKFNGKTAEPVVLSCCFKDVCRSCLEKTLKESQSLKCPFCSFDHMKYDEDYIKYYEFRRSNRKAWLIWWKRHVDIFL